MRGFTGSVGENHSGPFARSSDAVPDCPKICGAELGCPLARSTLCNWMQWLGSLLKPLALAQEREILGAFKRHSDDTEMRVLAPGRSHRLPAGGRMWGV